MNPSPISGSSLPETILPVDALVDPECGLIRTVRQVPHPPGAPARYTGLTAAVADARVLGEWPADRVSLGTTFNDPGQARIAAIAEGVERYCGNWLPAELPSDDLRIATRADLVADDLTAIEVRDLPTFADWQYNRPGFPYQRFTESTPTLWARCETFRGPGTGPATHVWVPSSLVHLNWRQSRFRSLPRTHHLNYAGIATGQGAEDARDRGVLEVIERDALEVWWHLDGPTTGIDPDSVPGLADDLAGSDFEVALVVMPSEFAPAVAALIHDPVTGLYAAGFSASLDPARAARKAVLEAIHTWVYTQGCTSADGWVFRAVGQGLMAKGLQLDYRPDATYLDAAGPRCEHVVDLGAHVQVWLDPRVHEQARRFTDPANGIGAIDDVAPVPMTDVYDRLDARGHRIITRDLTTSDVARTALRVVRTIITGLIPNAPAAFAYLGMPRLREVALERGWRTRFSGDPDEFTLLPPPHM